MSYEAVYKSIVKRFPKGLAYPDATQLCLGLYAVDELFDDINQDEVTKENIAASFAKLSCEGMVCDYSSEAASAFGAESFDISGEGHWLTVISAITRLGIEIDLRRIEGLIVNGAGGI